MAKRKVGDFSDFAEHPRYGRGPRFTDVRPRAVPPGYRLTTYVSGKTIGGTAVEADLERQTSSPVPVLYYFDLKRECVDCHRRFIFFAEEQKYWYESLGFVLDADCIRCTDCRWRQHGVERQRRRYEELVRSEDPSAAESLEMAECCLTLIESGLFTERQTQKVRMLLNSVTSTGDTSIEQKCAEIRRRMLGIETGRSGEIA